MGLPWGQKSLNISHPRIDPPMTFDNIFRHTCLSSVKQFIKCKQCKQFQQGITRATAIFDGIFKIRRLAKRKKLSYKTRSFVCQMLPWIIDLSYWITFLEIVIVDHFFH